MSTAVDERVTDEVEALEAILMSDIAINTVDNVPQSVEMVVHPSTGNDPKQQYVCVTLEVKLTQGYPDNSPEVLLRNPRGLDDKLVDDLYEQINKKMDDCRGQPVVFELIEVVREYLSQTNLPRGQCAICLYSFSDGDEFVKTSCYHYFHCHCLAKHFILGRKYYHEEIEKLPSWQQMQAQPYQETCPVCRSNILLDLETLKKAPPPVDSLTAPPFALTAELKALQRRMAALLTHQIAIGGVVGSGDDGPPPLMITSPADQDKEKPSSSGSTSPQATPIQASTSAPTRSDRSPATPSGVPSVPSVPSADNAGQRVPYRGFNRRAKPGRRGRGPR